MSIEPNNAGKSLRGNESRTLIVNVEMEIFVAEEVVVVKPVEATKSKKA